VSDAMIGHNSNVNGPDRKALQNYIREIEAAEEEKREAAQHISEIYKDAKSHGFDVKALREIVKLRREDAGKRREREAILETYMHALGMLADTPLGQSAVARAVAEPPKATLPEPDTSSPPFAAPDDEPRVADPGDGIPEFLQRV
jgi:uncharacterized protein (UPF0335 family)